MRIDMDGGFAAHLDGSVAALMERLGAEVEADAKANCPVRTGKLRDSIHHEVSGDSVAVGSDLDYSVFVEEGTRHMAAEPYLRPSLYKTRGD